MNKKYLESLGLYDLPEEAVFLAGFYEEPEMMGETGLILREEAEILAMIGMGLLTIASISNAKSVSSGNSVDPNTLWPHSAGLAINWLAAGLFQLGVATSEIGAVIEAKRNAK